jgi:hypothetical protein
MEPTPNVVAECYLWMMYQMFLIGTVPQIHEVRGIALSGLQLFSLSLIIFAAGIIGGVVNATRTGNGRFLRPRTVQSPQGEVQQPGLLYNALIGGVAAILSWALYGPLAELNVLNPAGSTQQFIMTLSSLGGAFFVGFGGARWLSAEADKNILQTTGSVAAEKEPSPNDAQRIKAAQTPVEALTIAKNMPAP